jgi:hypothetical protein
VKVATRMLMVVRFRDAECFKLGSVCCCGREVTLLSCQPVD